MDFVFVITSFVVATFISQTVGRNTIFYIRFFSFLVLNFASFVILNIFFDIKYFFISSILYISLVLAWAGFIIHISNSIVLSLIDLIGDNKTITKNELFNIYDSEKKYRDRISALIDGNYLFYKDDQIKFNNSLKNRSLLKLIIFLSKS